MKFNMATELRVPAHWELKKIGDIANFNTTSWTKKNAPNIINYIDIKSVSTGHLEEPRQLIFPEAPSRARRVVKNGDIIISTVRPNLKQFVLIEGRPEVNLTASTGFCVISVEDENLRWFLYSLITSDSFTSYLERVAEGAAYPAYKAADISESIVAVPPPEELSLIANLAKDINSQLNINTAMNQTLEKIAQRIFKSWFIDFDPVKANAEGIPFAGLSPDIQSLFPSEFVESEMGLIPKGWEISSLGEISDFQNGYAFKASTLSHEKSGNCKAVLKMGNIKKGGGFKWDGSKDYFTLQNGELGKLAKHIANRGDLLMSMTDMKANVALLGHTACMPVDGEFLVNQRVGHIKVKDIQTADYPFLYIQTNESKFIHELRSQANSGVQVNLSTSAIKAAKILLPAKTVHIAFNNAVKSMFERIFENEIQNRTLARIRGKLLPKLLSGSIKINQKLDEAS
jgi:type I restriction enzyme S subunit